VSFANGARAKNSLDYVDHECGRKDRLSREGMVPTIMHLQRLASYGVAFHSYTEAHLATDNELVRNILLALLASLAKVEAQKI